MNIRITSFTLLATLTMTAAIASTSAQAQSYRDNGYDRYDRHQVCDYCGTVRNVSRVTSNERRRNVGATVLGALIGGAIGNQIGDGDGRRAATVAGAVVGGAIGHNRGNDRRQTFYRVSVRMDTGRVYSFDQNRAYGLRPGSRVEIRNGELVRVG